MTGRGGREGGVQVYRLVQHVFFIINLLIIRAKFYLHKCKYSKHKPNFKHFYNDILAYIKIISGSLNKIIIIIVIFLFFFNSPWRVFLLLYTTCSEHVLNKNFI